MVLAAGVAVAIAAIGTAAYFGYQTYTGDNTPTSLPGPLPSVDVQAPQPSDSVLSEPTPMTTTVLDSEQTDPKKLTLKEAFAQQRVSVGGRAYTRAKVDITAQCEKVAVGTFATALKRQKCGRVLRATYVDSKQRYAVTTGIAVFPTKAAAVAADKKKNLGNTVWFRGLAGGAGSGADKADISGGYAAGLVWGRYIVFSFATYSDGHTPNSKEKDLGAVSGAFRDYTAHVIEKRVTG
ncbi:MAG: putative domain containing protein [Sphaerisporangium sp.]|nr:putative domain containing protein [Sphaerisporangium sp.]